MMLSRTISRRGKWGGVCLRGASTPAVFATKYFSTLRKVVRKRTIRRRDIRGGKPTNRNASPSEESSGDVAALAQRSRALNVALVGSPNAGKSSLVNQLIDTNVSAVSPKVNTTRTSIHGVKTMSEDNTQLVFVDLPGFVEPTPKNKKLFVSPLRKMVESALSTDDLEAVMLVVDATTRPERFDWAVVDKLADVLRSANRTLPCFLVLNKMDLLPPRPRDKRAADRVSNKTVRKLQNFDTLVGDLCRRASGTFDNKLSEGGIAEASEDNDESRRSGFDAVLYTSALKRWGLDRLEGTLGAHARERAWDYEADDVTSLTNEERMTEIVRSHLFRRLNSEVPYHSDLQLLETNELDDGGLLVRLVVRVRSKSHLRIVRSAVPYIERASVRDLRAAFGKRVEFYLSAKVG